MVKKKYPCIFIPYSLKLYFLLHEELDFFISIADKILTEYYRLKKEFDGQIAFTGN